MIGLTRRQWDLLLFLRRYISEHGYSPTYREISAGLGIVSKSPVHHLICQLEQRECVTRIPGARQSIALTEIGEQHVASFEAGSVPRETIRSREKPRTPAELRAGER